MWSRDVGGSDQLYSVGPGVSLWLAPQINLTLQLAKPIGRESERAGNSRDLEGLVRVIGSF